MRRAQRLRPGSAFLAQALAILTARTRGWTAAAPLFAAPAATRTPGAAVSLLRGRPAPAAALALPAPERPADLDPAAAAALVVYTTAFGDEPDPAPVFVPVPGLRFVCLTDRPLDVAGWEALPPAPGAPDPDVDPRRTAAWCRIRPDLALAEAAPAARASLYLGPDRWLVGNLNTLLLRWCLPHDLALWRHPHGIDWQDLAEHALVTGTPAAAAVIAQAEACAAAGLPRDRGAWDTGMIWRRHHAPEVTALMAAWWTAAEAPGLETVALYAALNGPAAPAAQPRLLPAALGTAEDNAFVRGAPAGAARRAGRRPGAAPGRWPWSMPRSTPARPRRTSVAGSSPRWSPPATPTSPTCAIPATSPASATGWSS